MCKEEDPAYEPDQPYLSQPGLTVSPSRTVPRDGDLVIEDFPLVHDGYNCKSTNFNSRFGVCTASSISKAMSPTATHTRCQLQHTVWLTCLRSPAPCPLADRHGKSEMGHCCCSRDRVPCHQPPAPDLGLAGYTTTAGPLTWAYALPPTSLDRACRGVDRACRGCTLGFVRFIVAYIKGRPPSPVVIVHHNYAGLKQFDVDQVRTCYHPLLLSLLPPALTLAHSMYSVSPVARGFGNHGSAQSDTLRTETQYSVLVHKLITCRWPVLTPQSNQPTGRPTDQAAFLARCGFVGVAIDTYREVGLVGHADQAREYGMRNFDVIFILFSDHLHPHTCRALFLCGDLRSAPCALDTDLRLRSDAVTNPRRVRYRFEDRDPKRDLAGYGKTMKGQTTEAQKARALRHLGAYDAMMGLLRSPVHWRDLMAAWLTKARTHPAAHPRQAGAIGYCLGGQALLEQVNGARLEAISHVRPLSMPPKTRRAPRSAERPWLAHADWCLHSDALPDYPIARCCDCAVTVP